jgi:hypothetical protein
LPVISMFGSLKKGSHLSSLIHFTICTIETTLSVGVIITDVACTTEATGTIKAEAPWSLPLLFELWTNDQHAM